jgi:hypothetical protein
MTSREVGSAAVIRGSAGSPHRPTPRPAGPHYPLVGPCAYRRVEIGPDIRFQIVPHRDFPALAALLLKPQHVLRALALEIA